VVVAPDRGMPYIGPKHSVLRLLALSTKAESQVVINEITRPRLPENQEQAATVDETKTLNTTV